ncbi:hypothetical protein D5085_13490 [Ectothiorhodospiraceae bacterium BW-2]|nr:hypothetical protein D5085_13490 [Ectothiorhodospiraceae bacterium BW-2]
MPLSQDHLGIEDRLDERYAVVYAPKRGRTKQRFPENVVEIYPSAEEALAHADEKRLRFAALVYGPSRSSEGFQLYYLLRWLQ